MRGQMTHLDTDVLAEFRAGLITGRRGARIAAHLGGCDRCAALDDQIAGISALLASVPAPAMPDRVAQRLDTVLAAEAARRDDPERARGDGAGESAAPGRPAARRGFSPWTWRVLVPAGAAVVLAAGGFGLSQIGRGPVSQSAASSAGSMQAGPAQAGPAQAGRGAMSAAGPAGTPTAAPFSPVPSAHAQVKSPRQAVTVTRATLRQQVQAELRLPPASRPTNAATAQILGCVHLLAGPAPVELVERARFDGQPATIIVARTGGNDTAWVAGPGCSATSRDVLDTITVPPGISEP
jgi:hypothetical protein